MRPNKITREAYTKNGDKIEVVIKSLGKGNLSSRYLITTSDSGEQYFAKTSLVSEHCAGLASRDINRNEVSVNSHLVENGIDEGIYFEREIKIGRKWYSLFKNLNAAGDEQIKSDLEKLLDVKVEEKDKKKARGKDVITKKTLRDNLNSSVYIVKSISDQLYNLHNFPNGKGVIHMDVSPGNILILKKDLGRGKYRYIPKLIDFGITREKGATIDKLLNRSTASGISGTYYSSDGEPLHNKLYSAPDILSKSHPNVETNLDTYNLVNILCLMLTKRLVEHWKNDKDDLAMVLERELNVDSSVKEDIIKIITKGTSDVRSVRYDDASVLSKELEDLGLAEPTLIETEVNLPVCKVSNKIKRTLHVVNNLAGLTVNTGDLNVNKSPNVSFKKSSEATLNIPISDQVNKYYGSMDKKLGNKGAPPLISPDFGMKVGSERIRIYEDSNRSLKDKLKGIFFDEKERKAKPLAYGVGAVILLGLAVGTAWKLHDHYHKEGGVIVPPPVKVISVKEEKQPSFPGFDLFDKAIIKLDEASKIKENQKTPSVTLEKKLSNVKNKKPRKASKPNSLVEKKYSIPPKFHIPKKERNVEKTAHVGTYVSKPLEDKIIKREEKKQIKPIEKIDSSRNKEIIKPRSSHKATINKEKRDKLIALERERKAKWEKRKKQKRERAEIKKRIIVPKRVVSSANTLEPYTISIHPLPNEPKAYISLTSKAGRYLGKTADFEVKVKDKKLTEALKSVAILSSGERIKSWADFSNRFFFQDLLKVSEELKTKKDYHLAVTWKNPEEIKWCNVDKESKIEVSNNPNSICQSTKNRTVNSKQMVVSYSGKDKDFIPNLSMGIINNPGDECSKLEFLIKGEDYGDNAGFKRLDFLTNGIFKPSIDLSKYDKKFRITQDFEIKEGENLRVHARVTDKKGNKVKTSVMSVKCSRGDHSHEKRVARTEENGKIEHNFEEQTQKILSTVGCKQSDVQDKLKEKIRLLLRAGNRGDESFRKENYNNTSDCYHLIKPENRKEFYGDVLALFKKVKVKK